MSDNYSEVDDPLGRIDHGLKMFVSSCATFQAALWSEEQDEPESKEDGGGEDAGLANLNACASTIAKTLAALEGFDFSTFDARLSARESPVAFGQLYATCYWHLSRRLLSLHYQRIEKRHRAKTGGKITMTMVAAAYQFDRSDIEALRRGFVLCPAFHGIGEKVRDELTNRFRALSAGVSQDTAKLRTLCESDSPLRRSIEQFASGDATAGESSTVKVSRDANIQVARKRRGRRKADYETVQREARLAAGWKRARENGVCKPEYARQNGMTAKEFDKLLKRVNWRIRVSSN